MSRDGFDENYRPLRAHAERTPGRASPSRAAHPWVRIVPAVVVVMVAFDGWLATANPTGAVAAPEPAVVAARSESILTREEFERRVVGRTEPEVAEAVGSPRVVTEFIGGVAWTFPACTTDPLSGQPDREAEVVFEGRTAVRVEYP